MDVNQLRLMSSLCGYATAIFVILTALTGFGKFHFEKKLSDLSKPGQGGDGGSGTIINGSGAIYGGRGGQGGSSGIGGAGGSGRIDGGNGIIIGGDGGSAGYIDAEGNSHGGAGGRSPLERLKELGLENPVTSKIEEHISRLKIEYIKTHPNVSREIINGTEGLPTEWVNNRFIELNIPWVYTKTPNGYSLSGSSSKN